MSIFDEVNEDFKKKQEEVKSQESKESKELQEFLQRFVILVYDMKKSLKKIGVEAEINDSKLEQGIILILNKEKDEGLFYHIDPMRKAISVNYNTGRYDRATVVYYPNDLGDNTVKSWKGNIVTVEQAAKEDYERLISKIQFD